MNEFLRRAKELEHQMQKDRRYLHQHAEAGEHLPGTTKYVMERLSSIGLSPREICDSGITALIEGSCPGKTILLRADMDALPMKEMNSLPFQTVTEAAHNCGHDIHTAMLLAAAQILHERRDELCGHGGARGKPIRPFGCKRYVLPSTDSLIDGKPPGF